MPWLVEKIDEFMEIDGSDLSRCIIQVFEFLASISMFHLYSISTSIRYNNFELKTYIGFSITLKQIQKSGSLNKFCKIT